MTAPGGIALAFELIIFDCDGTLVDSVASISRVCNLAMAELGLPGDRPSSEVGKVVGLSLPVAAQVLMPDLSPELHGRWVVLYKEHYRRLADAGALRDQLFPGVRETLTALRDGGRRLAMATGKSMRGVERTLKEHRLEGLFEAIKTADCAPSKPHPGMIELILAETGVEASRALMVGDTDFDLLMARHAGVKSCAVSWGSHDRARLAAALPDYWIEAMEQLIL
ncbi:MAG: HAD-IA family hydrolase [Magnetococcales bacterium]|nr:HAD-IA family hydrolase [Magnetococcales bacterium]